MSRTHAPAAAPRDQEQKERDELSAFLAGRRAACRRQPIPFNACPAFRDGYRGECERHFPVLGITVELTPEWTTLTSPATR